jgi:hypothetical protein
MEGLSQISLAVLGIDGAAARGLEDSHDASASLAVDGVRVTTPASTCLQWWRIQCTPCLCSARTSAWPPRLEMPVTLVRAVRVGKARRWNEQFLVPLVMASSSKVGPQYVPMVADRRMSQTLASCNTGCYMMAMDFGGLYAARQIQGSIRPRLPMRTRPSPPGIAASSGTTNERTRLGFRRARSAGDRAEAWTSTARVVNQLQAREHGHVVRES